MWGDTDLVNNAGSPAAVALTGLMRVPVLCLVVVWAGCASSKKSGRAEPKVPPELAQVAQLEDRRSLGPELKLHTLARSHPDATVRARALLALGRIQDPQSLDTVLNALTDEYPAVRTEAAFAAALLGLSWQKLDDAQKAKLGEALIGFETVEADPLVKLQLIDALARVGSLSAAERLIDLLTVPGDVQARAAVGLGVIARLLAPVPLPARAPGALTLLIKKELPLPTRYGGAYGLAAAKSSAARYGLLLCAQDEAAEVRAVCAKGLGDAGTDIDAVTLLKLLDDTDYRVAVEATRALAKLSGKCKGPCPANGALAKLDLRVERLIKGDTAGGGQPLLALAQQGLPAAGKGVLISLREQVIAGQAGATDARTKKDIANIDCRLAAAIDRINSELREVLTCGAGLIPENQRLALGLYEVAATPAKDPAKRVEELSSHLASGDARVKLAAIHLLGENKSATAVDRLRPLLTSSDPVIVAATVTALSRIGDKASIPAILPLLSNAGATVEIAPAIAEALEGLDAKEAIPELQKWLGSTHATVRIAAAAALTKLTGQRVGVPTVERPVNLAKAVEVPKDAVLTVRTEKGDFDVKLYTQDAPLTSANLFSLAKSKFFKNVTFHRIVPDFVAQGGDPRGDGEGGPGYTIRCELNRRPYTRGVVGMALGGKDTGGSQFFVMLAAHPHLDGKYTSFGEVVKGQEVVDALLEGDRILEVLPPPPPPED